MTKLFPSGRLSAVELLRVRIPLHAPITSAHGVEHERWSILVGVEGADGLVGWGECPALTEPTYTSEWHEGAWSVLANHLAPSALAARPAGVRGHPMATSAIEGALVDLELRRRGVSLATAIGATRERVSVCAVIGILPLAGLVERVEQRITAGHQSVKLKVRPGHDVEPVEAVRQRWPDLDVAVDANGSYEADSATLAALDSFGLSYIEQPLPPDDLVGHARLAERMQTRLALDEAISSLGVIETALALGKVGAVSLKPSRLGGFVAALDAHALLVAHDVPMWSGGMWETGIGRSAALGFAALPGCVLPTDVGPTSSYLVTDVVAPFALDGDGTVPVPSGPGVGHAPDPERLKGLVVERQRIQL